MSRASQRTCPFCKEDRVLSVEEAERVFLTSKWGGATSMLEDAEKVCSYCKVVWIDGDPDRMQTVQSRAYELAQSGGTKGVGDYVEILTQGGSIQDRTEDRGTDADVEW